jgi:hypothetical protein
MGNVMPTAGKTFQRREEDFVCERCGTSVVGDGYTNHCPYCLYGKHVDIFPGDRLETCGGLMEPVGYEKDRGQEKLTHRCLRCGKTKKNKVQARDSFEELLRLSARLAASKI